MQQLIENIARSLVDTPDQVSVRAVDFDGQKVLELRVAPGDLGRVIGRQGRTVRSLRAILNAAAAKKNRHLTLEIVEET
jgi:predicted RNA-binding protein YlqC (UPF0109 family)